MTAERDSMTLQEMGAPAPRGRSQPRAANAGPGRSWPSRRGASSPRSIDCGFWRRQRAARSPARWAGCFAARGLYSSHLTEWRRARREGSLQGLTPSKRGRKLAERNPLSAKVHELEAKVARLEKELHTAHTNPGRPGKSCRAAGIQPRTREGLLMAVQPLASQVGVAPACRALGVPRASFYRRQRPAPGHRQPRPTPRPGPACVRTRRTSLDVLASRASSTGHRPRSS